jgi:heme exporter protein A
VVSDDLNEIRLVDVRKIFGRKPVLSHVSCTLNRGQITLLMGPNGAGKSTLLSIVSTLSRPTDGKVLYGKHEHAHAESHLQGRIGLLTHTAMLYGQLSCRENLLFFARMYGLENPHHLVDQWLSRVGMEHASDQPVRELSRGMLQRVSLARALLHKPDLLLLDEPFTGLDRSGTQLLRDELQSAMDEGAILLLVTHDVEAVDGLSGHLVILDRGRMAADIEEPGLTSARILERYHATV